MAREDRPTSDAVAALFAELAREPYRFHLFQALRRLECAFPDHPRLGESARPKDDPVRLGQEPSLAFAPSALASFTPGDAEHVARLDTFFFGVFGPNGPLPLHLTEYARDRMRNVRDDTLRRFADIFHHRMASLFYRAWADAQPTVQHDRPDTDRFALYVGALFGLGSPALRGRDELPDLARLHYAGLFASPTRHAEGLERILAGFFRMPVRVEPFSGHWIDLPPSMLCRLGGGADTCALGRTVTLGERVWDCGGKFRVVFGPVGYDDFRRLLPGSESLARLIAIVRSWTGDELWWDVNVVLKQAEVPGVQLGRAGQLGWTSWLLSRPAVADARDFVLDPIQLAS